MDYLTCKEIAAIWGISARRVIYYCTDGRITGAIKKGNLWLVPKDSVKPTDPRKNKQKNND